MQQLKEINRFNIRVYGILTNEDNHVLLSDEFIRGKFFTKFPGGGLEYGEGMRDCLRREFKEETGLDVTVTDHIYTTDFFQQSAFNPAHQIVSVYYFVEADARQLETKSKQFDFTEKQIADPLLQCEVFRWIPWRDLSEDSVDLPIDKLVVKMLKQSAGF